MGMKRLSAVVTSAGIATAIGLSEESTWRSLLTGKSGVAPLNAYEYRGMKLPVGCCNLDSVKSHLESRGIPFAEKEQRAVLLAFYVISKALEKKEAPKTGEKRGLYVGSSLTTNEYLARGYENCFAGRRNPASAIMDGANCYFSSRISQVFGFRDSCVTISSSCASGLQCIGFAMRDLELGMVDEAVVVGVDSALIKALLDTWMSARILSKIDPAETASRPFCNTRRGFVYAEGAGCIVLRRKDSDPLLKITGVDFNCGPDNLFAVTQGDLIRCMRGALSNAGVSPEEIDFVHASASGSRQGDLEEAKALNAVFGRGIPVYASKSLYGNSHGASGITNLIHSMLALRFRHLPPNANVYEKDPEIEPLINCYYAEPVSSPLNTGLLNTFGFGGMNASIVFQRVK